MLYTAGCRASLNTAQDIETRRRTHHEFGSAVPVPQHVQTRWASPENPTAEKRRACFGNDGRKRHAFISLRAGASATLMDLRNTSGTVRRIWITIDDRSPKMLRGLRLEMYWDGAPSPPSAAPLGDFFCQGLGRMATFQSALFASPEGRSFNCYHPDAVPHRHEDRRHQRERTRT